MTDISAYSIEELNTLAGEIREKILTTVSRNGGHLSSTLGAVDLIVAMHKVFDVRKDPFIFDVSHQAYAHKLLTDRWDRFDTLRQFGGLSGYTKPSESPYDYYVAGHSSTSISLAVGAAKAIMLKGEERIPVAFIGDGSMSAGMVYEALNELGDRKYPVVIILNDNEMSIAKPIGAISKLLSQTMAGSFYQKFKGKVEKVLDHFPEGATYMAKRFEESFKLITPGILFEEMGIEYIGPVDGHDIESLIETMEVAKAFGKPVIIHAQTTKGKGYEIAEGTKEHWHGVSAFDLKTGESAKKNGPKAATAIFSETLLAMAEEDEKVVGVTAAMPSGTGMSAVMEKYPERFWDVAIAEQHAVTSMGPLAKEGFKPFCTIYSTFLQRGYISYLRPIPNMTLLAPYNETTMKLAMAFAKEYDRPCAFRYPRGAFMADDCAAPAFELGRSDLLQEGDTDILFIGYGNGVGRAQQTADHLDVRPGILDLRFVKPLDEEMLAKLGDKYKKWFIFSDSAKQGGVGSAILEFLSRNSIHDIALTSFEYDDAFITHGNTKLVEQSLGLLPEQIARTISEKLKIKK
ncbi:MAG: 1-deoxy-D-xylulose-5-phosphate synthase [Epsilonproteobacteria bacterium 4484_20]|nr:MAG: 1-deoxy-D-xylulose-5-phosphate synthase [Epsilonproteobacteria bacterium 4484_20]